VKRNPKPALATRRKLKMAFSAHNDRDGYAIKNAQEFLRQLKRGK
jgi:hypothetical protein